MGVLNLSPDSFSETNESSKAKAQFYYEFN